MDMTAKVALMTALAASSKVVERTIVCSDGMKLAAQHWQHATTSDATRRILCLHGWLDNCRSFHYLAPKLLNDLPDTEIVAIDFPGHGWSSHKSPDGPPILFAEMAYYVYETAAQLEWESFVLVGHSMGAGASVLYAATFPEQVERIVLLDGAGPLPRPARDFSKHVRKAVQRRHEGNPRFYPQFTTKNKDPKGPRIYPSLELAVDTRCRTAGHAPGNQYLSKKAACEMVKRGTLEKENGGVQFRHDPRLQWPSLQYMSHDQVQGLYNDIQCPVCLLMAEDGWPLDQKVVDRVKELLQPTVFQMLKGSHHFHADPDTCEAVADAVIPFLRQAK